MMHAKRLKHGRKSSPVGRLGFKPSWWCNALLGGFDSRFPPPQILCADLFCADVSALR